MLLILFNSIKTTLAYAYFEIDPIGFIENFCENKDQPELQCHGKCQLKKVAESQNRDQNTPDSLIDYKELILYINQVSEITFEKKIKLKKQPITSYCNHYSFNNSNYCFHPPRV